MMQGTRWQFETIAKLSEEQSEIGGHVISISDSQFENVLKVEFKHWDQRDGDWTVSYLVGPDGNKMPV